MRRRHVSGCKDLLLPEPWVWMPPPQDSTDWNWFGFNEFSFGHGRLGRGTVENPLYPFGDASGGEDSRGNRLRRVGVGIAVYQELTENMTMNKAV